MHEGHAVFGMRARSLVGPPPLSFAKGRNHDDTDRLLDGSRPRCRGARREPQPTRRQRHRRDQSGHGAGAKAGRDVAPDGTESQRHRRARQPERSRSWRAIHEGSASGCPRTRIADTYRPGQHRTRHRSDLRKLGPTRGRRAGRLAQCVLRQPPRSNRRAWRYVTRCLPSTSSASSLPPAG